jgi:peptidoglycan/LPS O-acetylase OafA/YrhL
MRSAGRGTSQQPKSRAKAIIFGFIAALVTAVAVSQSTPDGNLVVTLVPALVVGVAVFGLAMWHFRR